MSLYNHKLHYRPLRAGVEIYNENVAEVGTLGFIAQSPQGGPGRWIVSCYHVLVGPPDRTPVDSEQIQQPAGGDTVALLDATRADVDLDCAAAKIVDGIMATGEILGIGNLGAPTEPVAGMRLIKSGATTGITEGVVESITGNDVTIAIPTGFDPNYELSRPGDSGSLWLTRDTLQPVALHIREMPSANKKCSARRIIPSLTALNLNVVSGP